MGLQGMIDDMLAARRRGPVALRARRISRRSRPATAARWRGSSPRSKPGPAASGPARARCTRRPALARAPVLGITGTGGAGKCSLTDELVRRFRLDQHDRLHIAMLSVDPSRRKTGGALLGDRIRMNAIDTPHVFMRSLATRAAGSEISGALARGHRRLPGGRLRSVIVETSGIGQGDAAIVPLADVSLYVMTPEFGAASQLEKIDMLDFADFVAINKFDRSGAADALRDVRKQYQRNRAALRRVARAHAGVRHHRVALQRRWRHRALPGDLPRLAEQRPEAEPGRLPAPSTQASTRPSRDRAARAHALPRRDRGGGARLQAACARAGEIARELQQLTEAQRMLLEHARRRRSPQAEGASGAGVPLAASPDALIAARDAALDPAPAAAGSVAAACRGLRGRRICGEVRDREIRTELTPHHALRHSIPQGGLAQLRGPRRDPRWLMQENVPGSLPVHGRRVRLQARERGSRPACSPAKATPFRTNRRFHLLSERHAGQAPVHGLRLGHPLRLRTRPAARHLRQGGQLRRVDRHAGRHEGALLRLRSVRARAPRCP